MNFSYIENMIKAESGGEGKRVGCVGMMILIQTNFFATILPILDLENRFCGYLFFIQVAD